MLRMYNLLLLRIVNFFVIISQVSTWFDEIFFKNSFQVRVDPIPILKIVYLVEVICASLEVYQVETLLVEFYNTED